MPRKKGKESIKSDQGTTQSDARANSSKGQWAWPNAEYKENRLREHWGNHIMRRKREI